MFRCLLLASGTFVVMLMLTTDLPVGSRSPETHYQWAAKHLLTTPLSLGTIGLRTPTTLNYLAGFGVHVAAWAAVLACLQAARSAMPTRTRPVAQPAAPAMPQAVPQPA